MNEISYNYSRGGIFSAITGNAARDVAIPKVWVNGAPGDDLLPGIVFGGGTYGIPAGLANAGRAWDFLGRTTTPTGRTGSRTR